MTRACSHHPQRATLCTRSMRLACAAGDVPRWHTRCGLLALTRAALAGLQLCPRLDRPSHAAPGSPASQFCQHQAVVVSPFWILACRA